MELEKLYKRSIQIILDNQHASGGYIASPTFQTYHYCWFRDGAYIAYSMDLAGEIESAGCFHDWAASNILKRQDQLLMAVDIADKGEEIPEQYHLHTRYGLEGDEAEGFWENFQLDGLGTWLWSLGEHLKCGSQFISEDWVKAAGLLYDYLVRTWMLPCYDLWEENRNNIHIYTLASIYRGLMSAADFLGRDADTVCSEIRDRIKARGTKNRALCKYEGSSLVDGALAGVFVPGEVFSIDDSLFKNTLERIETELLAEGGVHRYLEDSYYGGGIWLLLRGWLGICQLRAGNRKAAVDALEWMAANADESGYLPEQLDSDLLFPAKKNQWIEKWGVSASPLLWSHAVYIWLYNELQF